MEENPEWSQEQKDAWAQLDNDDLAEVSEIAVEHAVRCWEAECENAERYAKKRNVSLSIVFAVFGFGLFKSDWVSKVDTGPEWVFWVLLVLVTLSIFAFVAAIWHMVIRREKAGTTTGKPDGSTSISASGHLPLSDQFAYFLEDSKLRTMVYLNLSEAADELRNRNKRVAKQINKGQSWLVAGIFFVALAFVWYNGTGGYYAISGRQKAAAEKERLDGGKTTHGPGTSEPFNQIKEEESRSD